MKSKTNKGIPHSNKRVAANVPVTSNSPIHSGAPGRIFGLSRDQLTLVLCALLFFLVFRVFYPITSGDFINYDDDVYVTDNFHVQAGIGLRQIAWAFENTDAANWHPLTWLSHMLDCQLYGVKPWGHHLTSVLFHAINTMLLFLLMRSMTGALWRSLFVALLFGLHPLRVESVAWVSERKDVLSAFFWMLTLWAYVRYVNEFKVQASAECGVRSGELEKRETSRPKFFYGLTLLCFALGLMSKPMVVTLPFVLLLLDYWPLNRIYDLRLTIDESKDSKIVPRVNALGDLLTTRKSYIVNRKLLLEKAPFFVLSAAGCVITFLAQRSQGAVIDYLPFVRRVENAALSYGRYLGKFFYPANLAILYPHPVNWPIGKILAATALFAALTTIMITVRRTRPYCLMGWLWFVGTLVPVIGLVQVGSQSMADRYMYIPCIGLNIILVWGTCDLARSLPGRRILAASAVSAAIVCAVLARHQISFWKNSGTVFSHAVAVTEDGYQARKALGDYYCSQGRLEDAMALYRQAIEMNPKFEGAHLNLGAALNQAGRVAEAMDEFRQAIKLKPDDAEAYNDLGAVLGGDRLKESISLFQKAIELNPNYADAHKNLGQAMDFQGNFAEALHEYQQAIQLKPGYDACYLSGVELEKLGRKSEAIIQFNEALRLQPGNVNVQQALERLRSYNPSHK